MYSNALICQRLQDVWSKSALTNGTCQTKCIQIDKTGTWKGKKTEKNFMPPFLYELKWDFFFQSAGTWWHILTVALFLSVAKNRSPWKHYASHSLSGNTRDSEPWRMCEYVSKSVSICVWPVSALCVREDVRVCTCGHSNAPAKKRQERINDVLTSKCPCYVTVVQEAICISEKNIWEKTEPYNI